MHMNEWTKKSDNIDSANESSGSANELVMDESENDILKFGIITKKRRWMDPFAIYVQFKKLQAPF